MANRYYETDIRFKETGTGQGEIRTAKALAGKEWHYVLVHEGEPKAIVQVEASAEDHEVIAAAGACRPLTEKQMGALRKTYPPPKLKQKYEVVEGERVLQTYQTVRWRFYLIDVPMPSERSVFHVVPDKGTKEWHIKQEGVSEPVDTHATKSEAVAAATSLAKRRMPSQVKIHKQDGTIQREYTYGDDPASSAG